MQWSQDRGHAREEAVKKIDATKEPLQLHLGGGTWNGGDGVNLGGEGGNPCCIYRVAEVRDLRDCHDTFLPVKVEASGSEATEDGVKVIEMLLERSTGNQNIVKVDKYPLQAAKDTIHQPLERLCGVLETERHPEELVKAKRRYDGRLLNVFGGHRDLMIAPHQVQDGKHRCPVSDVRKRVNMG